MKLCRSTLGRVGILLALSTSTFAGAPLWTFTPLTTTTISVPTNSTATVQYQITNQSSKPHTLKMQSIPGITQVTVGAGICAGTFTLTGKSSCTLSLQIIGSALNQPITSGPVVCEQGSPLQCYQPTAADSLHITPVPPSGLATISVSGSPLTLTTNGPTGTLTINNTSSSITAFNIISNFNGTALDGNVSETGNTCLNVAPLSSCTLTYTPGGSSVPLTNFSIEGGNTNTASAQMEIDSSVTFSSINPSSGIASGGTGVTLTGTGFTGATSVTFGGVSATGVNVINSTTVTAVTPAHAAGVVDVEIDTPSGNATLVNGYTYVATAIGEPAFGGVVACLNGGMNNLITAVLDAASTTWGGFGITTGATSNTDGSSNTITIVTALGPGTYAAQMCADYEIDSQGNTPCQAGNVCYNDWFLPAGNNSTSTGQLNCLYINRASIGNFSSASYWSSTQASANNAWIQNFNDGSEATLTKNNTTNVRCVRAFSP